MKQMHVCANTQILQNWYLCGDGYHLPLNISVHDRVELHPMRLREHTDLQRKHMCTMHILTMVREFLLNLLNAFACACTCMQVRYGQAVRSGVTVV